MVKATKPFSLSDLTKAMQCYHFDEAEEMLRTLLARYENDPVHSSTFAFKLASVYIVQGRYDEAKALLEQTLRRVKETLGTEHSEAAKLMCLLALLHKQTGQYAEAESYSMMSLSLVERAPSVNHGLGLLWHASQLANLYLKQRKYLESRLLCERILSGMEESAKQEFPFANLLTTVAATHVGEGNYSLAEPPLELALSIYEKFRGSDHDLSRALSLRGELYCRQGKFAEAESLVNRALSIREAAFGLKHVDVADTLEALAGIYIEQKKYSEAESVCKRALSIKEDLLGLEHPEVAENLRILAFLCTEIGDYDKASALFERALIILRKKVAPNHITLVRCLKNYDRLLSLTR